MSDTWTATGTENEYQAAPNVPQPTLIVLAILKGGKLVKAEWSGQIHQLSDRTLEGMQAIGMIIEDNKDNYLFPEGMI